MINIFPRHRTGRSRLAATAALTATVVLALTGFASAANASAAAPQKVRQVACRTYTFNVTHGSRNVKTCYEGTGIKVVRLGDVHVITTGENSGSFELILHGTLALNVKFHPKHTYRYKGNQVELVAFAITRT
jgi:hypothetical protein